MNELALFAGAGGGILGGHLLGWRTVCAVEWESYPASVLCARQNDGFLPPFPIWDDVQTFDGKPWRGIVDVVSGGFPCQDISAAGKGAGIDGERSGMWGEMARIIHEVRPIFVFVENSPMLTSRGLGRVLGDLASMGFDARWGVLGAADIGANHQRDRIWIVAKRNRQVSHSLHNGFGWGKQQPQSVEKAVITNTRCKPERPNQGLRPSSKVAIGENTTKLCEEMANTSQYGIQSQPSKAGKSSQWINSSGIGNPEWWAVEPNVGRVVDGLASRVVELKALGNGQVPLCAATAWRILND
jgi:DNA (cytosine-5)-methyltransferase 1